MGKAKIEVFCKGILIDIFHARFGAGAAEANGQVKAMLLRFSGPHLILEANSILRRVIDSLVTEVVHVLAPENKVQALGDLGQADFATQSQFDFVIETVIPVVNRAQTQTGFSLFEIPLIVPKKVVDPLGHLIGFLCRIVMPGINPTFVVFVWIRIGRRGDFLRDRTGSRLFIGGVGGLACTRFVSECCC